MTPPPRCSAAPLRALTGAVMAALATFAAATFAAAPAARAEDLLVESWVGGPSAQERQWATRVRDELARAGFLAAPAEILQVMGARLPMSPLSNPGSIETVGLMDRFSAARATFGEAVSLYRGGRFQAAEKLLHVLVTEAQQNPLIFASEVARPVFREAMIYLALSRSRMRQPAAAATTAEELVRTFPGEADKVFVEFGPTADKLYRAAEARLAAQGKGTLLVEVNDADAVVIVNEGATNNRAFEGEVPPGTYRVMVKTSSDGARRYEIPVKTNETARLTIDWKVDRVLSLTAESASFIFDSDRARSAEGAVGVSLARTLGKGPRVILLGSRIYDGYRALSASLYDVQSGRHLHTALAVMDGQRTDAKLDALMELLVSGKPAAKGLIVVSTTRLETVAELPAAPGPPRAAAAPSRWDSYATGVAALAAFAGGIALMEHDRDSATLSYALFGTSLLLTGYAAYSWSIEEPTPRDSTRRASSPRSKSRAAMVSPIRGGAIGWLGWAF